MSDSKISYSSGEKHVFRIRRRGTSATFPQFYAFFFFFQNSIMILKILPPQLYVSRDLVWGTFTIYLNYIGIFSF